MRNKYMRRGLGFLTAGILLNVLGWEIKINNNREFYGWAMILGTVLFGVGFLLILYSLIRKVEREAILEERRAEAEKTDKR